MTQSVPKWIEVLRADVEATGSIQKTADRVGVTRGALSAIINQTPSSPYVNGKSSTAKIEARVMNTIGRILCPFLSEVMGEEHRITGLECRESSDREHPPTNSPRSMAHWRACQACDKRLSVPVQKVVKVHKQASGNVPVEPPQQAGIIDKVTLPLPVVGGPQVEVAP